MCLGEVLTDFVALDVDVATASKRRIFTKLQVARRPTWRSALARLGAVSHSSARWAVTRSADALRETLAAEGVDVRGLLAAPAARTALAFVGSDGHGGREFVFYHHGMADTLLHADEVDRELIAHAGIFHFGSVTLAAEPSRAATSAAARWAHERGCLVSFDPNVRLEVWDSPRQALDAILEMLGVVDVVKVSADELAFLTGTSDPVDACRILRGARTERRYCHAGRRRLLLPDRQLIRPCARHSRGSVDSLGAGDAFMAGVLACLATQPASNKLGDAARLEPALHFANAVGAITTTRYGAIPRCRPEPGRGFAAGGATADVNALCVRPFGAGRANRAQTGDGRDHAVQLPA